MRGDPLQFDVLVERFMKLGSRDKRAVLASLSPGERGVFEREVAAAREARRREQDSARVVDRQFVGYSSWLATIVADALKDAENGDPARTEACSKAIALAHRAGSEQPSQPTPFNQLLRHLGIAGSAVGTDERK